MVATLRGTFSGGQTAVFDYTLVKEQGLWKIDTEQGYGKDSCLRQPFVPLTIPNTNGISITAFSFYTCACLEAFVSLFGRLLHDHLPPRPGFNSRHRS